MDMNMTMNMVNLGQAMDRMLPMNDAGVESRPANPAEMEGGASNSQSAAYPVWMDSKSSSSNVIISMTDASLVVPDPLDFDFQKCWKDA